MVFLICCRCHGGNWQRYANWFLTCVPESCGNAIDRYMNATLDPCIGLSATVTSHKFNLEMVKWVNVWKTVMDGAL